MFKTFQDIGLRWLCYNDVSNSFSHSMGYTDFIGGKESVAKENQYSLYWEEYDKKEEPYNVKRKKILY